MDRHLIYADEYSTYPGKYVPMPEIEELLKDKNQCLTQPSVNLDEFDNFFRIEVSLPGIKKQDIIILVEENVLTIDVVHKGQSIFESTSRIHEFNMNYFERQIVLPHEADAEFAAAEYRDGILTLTIPKTPKPSAFHQGKIVVY
jgi:HSP20 family protein